MTRLTLDLMSFILKEREIVSATKTEKISL